MVMRPRVDFFQTFRPCAPALAASGKTAATFDACAGQAESGALGHPFHIETRLTEQIPGQGDPGSGNGVRDGHPGVQV
jgi:hypothetical protein